MSAKLECDFDGLEKISRASIHVLFVFVGFLMIISIHRNKRNDRRGRRSNFIVSNVSETPFFGFDDHFISP